MGLSRALGIAASARQRGRGNDFDFARVANHGTGLLRNVIVLGAGSESLRGGHGSSGIEILYNA